MQSNIAVHLRFIRDCGLQCVLVREPLLNKPFRLASAVSERRACSVVGQPRATQRRHLKTSDDEAALTADIVRLATRYGRYGYRRIREMLVAEGWRVNVKRVYRIWRREGLKVPMKQPKRGRLWLNDGSCIRLRPERPNHVWSYDFVQDRTQDGRPFRMLVVLDEFTRRCLAISVARRLRSDDCSTVWPSSSSLTVRLSIFGPTTAPSSSR